jgi:hypothetical protein
MFAPEDDPSNDWWSALLSKILVSIVIAVFGALVGFVFKPFGPLASQAATEAVSEGGTVIAEHFQNACDGAATHWGSVERENTIPAYREHLRQFPKCRFAGLAQQKIAKLQSERTEVKPFAAPPQENEASRHEPPALTNPVMPVPRRDSPNPGSENGAVVASAGWLGANIQTAEGGGALVSTVIANSPAMAAGLQQNDLITALDGALVQDAEDLATRISARRPGTQIDLCVVRSGTSFLVSTMLDLKPAPQRPRIGITLDPEKAAEGVMVASVDPSMDAFQQGIQKGDVILSVNNVPVTSAADLLEQISLAHRLGRRSVLTKISSEDGVRFIAVKLTLI